MARSVDREDPDDGAPRVETTPNHKNEYHGDHDDDDDGNHDRT